MNLTAEQELAAIAAEQDRLTVELSETREAMALGLDRCNVLLRELNRLIRATEKLTALVAPVNQKTVN